MEVIVVNKANFEKEVLNSDKKVLADFNADWCGPCKMLGPVLEELSSTFSISSLVEIYLSSVTFLTLLIMFSPKSY